MQSTFKPETENQVIDALSMAISEGCPLEICGGETKRAIGRPLQSQTTLNLTNLSGILLYEPEELILTARAGTRLSDIEAAVSEKNQELAFEPADFGPLLGQARGKSTLGGTLAANVSGPRRIRAGAARDHFLGVKAISGRAEFFKSGGRVVKNVTGYDLCKGLAGSWGTLAVMTEITIKVLPAAEQVVTLLVVGLTADQAVISMSAAMNSSCEVSAAAYVPAALCDRSSVKEVSASNASKTLLRLEGIGPSVDYRAERLSELMAPFGATMRVDGDGAKKIWQEIRDVTYFADDLTTAIWRLSVPPSNGAQIASAIADKISGTEAFFDWAGGLLWLSVPEGGDASAQTIRGFLDPNSGHATLIRASASIRAAVDVFDPLEPGLMALSKRLKENFDPTGVLNSGRMYSNL